MADESKQGSDEAAAKKINVLSLDYIKSNLFRVIHIDGSMVGGGPTGVFVTLFNERLPIPQQQVFEIGSDGTMGRELKGKRVSRKGIIREVEAGIAMTIEAAEKLRDQLTKFLEMVEESTSDAPVTTPDTK